MIGLKSKLLLVVLSLVLLPSTVAEAGTFRRTKVMDIQYAWGTTSLTEFDQYNLLYPGYFPIAELTFEPDGTFTVVDTATGNTGYGIYDKRGRNLEITIVAPNNGYLVQYVGRKVSRGVFEGEILVNGNVQGHWRGTL
ncbi:MAG: hypothetical protein AAFN77_00830 [Planctomycetota bacterium]